MKTLLIITICLAFTTLKAQVVDTTFKIMTACQIVPQQVTFIDTSKANYIAAKIVDDDLKSRAIFFYSFYKDNNVLLSGNIVISGNEYNNWNGNNIFPFTYIANKFNLIFKN